MGDIRFNGVIYASSDSANITYKDTSVYNKLEELSENNVINGLVVNVTAANWDLQANGTYKKIIPVEQITGKETLDVCLYPGDSYTNEQAIAFSELITFIETAEGRIILTATEEITESFRIFLYGKVSFDKSNLVALTDSVMEVIEITREDFDKLSEEQKASGVYHVIDDTEELSAKNLEYDDTETQLGANNVQDAIGKLNSNLGGFTPVIDDAGKITGYKTSVGGADTVFPFKSMPENYIRVNTTYGQSASNGFFTFTNMPVGKIFIIDVHASVGMELTGLSAIATVEGRISDIAQSLVIAVSTASTIKFGKSGHLSTLRSIGYLE